MTHTDTKTKKRYTLREVQQTASSTYGLLVQPLYTTRAPYGIWFEGQLVWQCSKLTEVVEALPRLYTAIQEQLAEEQKEIAPVVEEAIAVSGAEEVASQAAEENFDKNSATQSLQHSEFSYHAYEDLTNWELREQLNERGYKDAMQYLEPLHNAGPYMAGFNRGVRDRRPVRI